MRPYGRVFVFHNDCISIHDAFMGIKRPCFYDIKKGIDCYSDKFELVNRRLWTQFS